MKDGGGLVLSVAGAGQARKIAEEKGAVGDVVVGGESVSKNTR